VHSEPVNRLAVKFLINLDLHLCTSISGVSDKFSVTWSQMVPKCVVVHCSPLKYPRSS